jgi:hypothetical protein
MEIGGGGGGGGGVGSSGDDDDDDDDVPAHISLYVQKFMAKNKMAAVPITLLSGSCSDFLFPKTRLNLKGKRFNDVFKIQLSSFGRN